MNENYCCLVFLELGTDASRPGKSRKHQNFEEFCSTVMVSKYLAKFSISCSLSHGTFFSVLALNRKESSGGLFTKTESQGSVFPILQKLRVNAVLLRCPLMKVQTKTWF